MVMYELLEVYNISISVNRLWDNFMDSLRREAMRVVSTRLSSAFRPITGFLNKNCGTWLLNNNFCVLSHTKTHIKLKTLTHARTHTHVRA